LRVGALKTPLVALDQHLEPAFEIAGDEHVVVFQGRLIRRELARGAPDSVEAGHGRDSSGEILARVVAQGDTRPMAGNKEAMDDLRRILDGRATLYGQADAIVDTAGKTIEQSLAELKKATETEPNRRTS